MSGENFFLGRGTSIYKGGVNMHDILEKLWEVWFGWGIKFV